MKTRILLAIGGMYGGGAERQILQLLQNLDRDRYEPELYLVTGRGELFSQLPDDVPVHIHERRVSPTRGLLPGAAMRAIEKDLADVLSERQIDVVWDRTYHMTLLTAGATRRRPTPRVSVIVSDPESDFETNPERFRSIKRWLLRRAYRDADVVATVSEGVQLQASFYHRLPIEQIEVVYNFFDEQRIASRAAEALPEDYQKIPDQQRIVASGRLCTAKAYDVLIDAMAHLIHEQRRDSLQLLILGAGPLEDSLRRQVADKALTDHVRLTGFLENPLPVVKSADVFCLSSRYEGMPNALVEAMLCGVPVVSTDCPSGPREILEDGRWGALVDPEDANLLARALADALENREDRLELAGEARQSIIDRFSLATGLRRVDEIVELAQRRFRSRRAASRTP